MPIRPSIQTLQANTPKILNAIRNDLGGTYSDLIPMANDTVESIRAIGNIVMEQSMLQNSFLSALINRVGMTIITSKSYSNPWNMFKKGKLDFGETIEEIFVSMAKPYQYNPDDAGETLFKQYKPDVQTMFHRLNFAKMYPVTIKQAELKQAFLSLSGVTDLIARITESLYTGMEYDEFIMMKYLLAKSALYGKIYPVTIPTVSKANLEDIASTIKATSSNLTYFNTNYNFANVPTHTPKDEQYVIIPSNFESTIDVSLLAPSFHMEKAEFMGHRVPVDNFAIMDIERLKLLLSESNESFEPFTESEIAELQTIQTILIDKDFFMIFDNLEEMNDVYNPKGLYWNYFLHVWKTFSLSPFANAVLFTTLTPSITSVSLNINTATMGTGTKMMLVASVNNVGFANNTIKWTCNSEKSVVTPDGQVTIGADETATTVTVTATSVFDDTKTAQCVITIANNSI